MRGHEKINNLIEEFSEFDPSFEKGKISDGYHTFDELYEHRINLYIHICKIYACEQHLLGKETKNYPVWKSMIHSDGSSYDGWFVLGIYYEKGNQITYHLPMSKWDETFFAEILDKAPEYDGHTSADVLERLKTL